MAHDKVRLKPRLLREPGAWARRKLMLKLNDALWGLGLRVLDRVDFSEMRAEAPFAHILDVGVADGTPDLYKRFPEAFLDLFEPSPQHHDHLRSGVLARRAGRLHPVALGATQGEASLFVTGRSGSTLIEPLRKQASEIVRVSVPVQRLDSILAPSDLHRPSLLKIDTDGYELDVLRGAEGVLPAIDCVVAEVHFDKPETYTPHQLVDFLASRGFALADMLDHHVRDHRMVCADMVFQRLQSLN